MTINSQGQWGSVGEEYRYGLRDLTFNSKPIINNLTLFAQDHVQSAPELARVLTEHLVTVCTVWPPSQSPSCSLTHSPQLPLCHVVPPRVQAPCIIPYRLYCEKHW